MFGQNDGNRMFPLTNDEEFHNMAYPAHQQHRSPLLDIDFPCVTGFPLDYMHLVCLGVVRRMLLFLRKGPRVCKLSSQMLARISQNLMALNGQLPSEFARQPRSLEFLEKWKATEFRQFLLYTGPIVMKGIVPQNLYKHFLALAVSVSFLLDSDSDKRSAYLGYARQLLRHFVETSDAIWSATFNVYNVHNLLHLADDVEHHHCSLNDISAFSFENSLQRIKKHVRSSRNPIVQVAKRIAEAETAGTFPTVNSHFRYVSPQRKDFCFMLRTEQFLFAREKRHDGQYLCDVFRKRHLENFFHSPCDSQLLNIYYISDEHTRNGRRQQLHKSQFYRKVVCLSYDAGYVLIPMLHGQEGI